ncbi:MAG TPA: class I SAM-dependent methyltransferase [Pseudogracilibacillus sp.]|nr:class I SAM-dependent methyltransferase [Pseudogracilibacillus sp.]
MTKQTNIIKKRYDRIASLFNMMDHAIRPSWREDLLKNVQGNILEVGVGTGANFPYYPEGVHVIGIDFSPKMLEVAEKKISEAKASITLKEMDAEQMDFPDNSFDVVVSTCVFCSVPNPIRGLQEIRRVVKPDGKVVMLEHMRSNNKIAAKMLDIINPITVRMSGANVNRETIKNIENAGLKIEEEQYLMTSIMRKITASPNKQ